MPMARPIAVDGPGQATPGAPPGAATGGSRAESGLELGHPYLPTSVRGVWLYLYLVIDVWSRKVVAWDVTEREEAQIAADLVSRACLRERISKGRPQPLILHADNGNAMRAATLESRLEALGVLRSFSRPRVSNNNAYSESLFRTVKFRPDYPRRSFLSVEQACAWVAAFVRRYNDQHRHSGIRFVTPSQRHCGDAVAVSRHRARVYEQARQRTPRRWSRTTHCWRQPEVVWINPPPPEQGITTATLVMAA
jgi:putative transposase